MKKILTILMILCLLFSFGCSRFSGVVGKYECVTCPNKETIRIMSDNTWYGSAEGWCGTWEKQENRLILADTDNNIEIWKAEKNCITSPGGRIFIKR